MSINGFRSCGISPWKVKLEEQLQQSQPYKPNRFNRFIQQQNIVKRRNYMSKSEKASVQKKRAKNITTRRVQTLQKKQIQSVRPSLRSIQLPIRRKQIINIHRWQQKFGQKVLIKNFNFGNNFVDKQKKDTQFILLQKYHKLKKQQRNQGKTSLVTRLLRF